MKKIILLLIIAVILVACNLPFTNGASSPQETSVPDAIQLPDQLTTAPTEPPVLPSPTVEVIEGTELNLGGVYMVIPSCLPVTASGVIEPAQLPDPNGGPMSAYPEHRRIDFSGYPLSGKFWEPVLRVYPVAEYAPIQAYSTEMVTALQNLVAARPAEVEGSLPFLPTLGAAQVFHIKTQYLDFQNGSGVRYLTEYAQYSAPFNNHDLFYTFQGLTADGKYWISAMFPINHPILPPTYDSAEVPAGGIAIPQMTSPTYVDEMNAYNAAMKALMESQPVDSFTPAIDCIDRYISSLSIGD